MVRACCIRLHRGSHSHVSQSSGATVIIHSQCWRWWKACWFSPAGFRNPRIVDVWDDCPASTQPLCEYYCLCSLCKTLSPRTEPFGSGYFLCVSGPHNDKHRRQRISVTWSFPSSKSSRLHPWVINTVSVFPFCNCAISIAIFLC